MIGYRTGVHSGFQRSGKAIMTEALPGASFTGTTHGRITCCAPGRSRTPEQGRKRTTGA
jgi:hypothetical protein